MENKVENTVRKYSMLESGDTVVIGLSGGADSCALLYFLISLREKLNLRLIACHVNHLLRGEEAFRDEEFSHRLCEENHVEFRLLRADVAAIAAQQRESTEKTGREIRYHFFEETALAFDAKIATAHTASDNAETIIFNLARGSGLHGMSGIPPVRGRIIRPLIEVTREEIERYCQEKNICYVTDSTNLTEDYTRNRIRHNVIPVLKEINPSLENTITKMCSRMRDISACISVQAKKTLQEAKIENGYKAEILYNSEPAVFAEIMWILLSEYGILPEAVHIELVRGILQRSGAVEIRGNIYAVSKQGILRIINKDFCKETDNETPSDIEGKGNIHQEYVVIHHKKFKLSKVKIDEYNKYKKIVKNLFNYALDYDTIPLTAVFRTRKSGDKITLAGRNVSKTLKKYFCELKIPAENRERVAVLADGSDILWIDGGTVGQRYAVSSKTDTVLMISVAEK